MLTCSHHWRQSKRGRRRLGAPQSKLDHLPPLQTHKWPKTINTKKKKKVKTRPRESQPFPNSKCENQTRGVEEREVVLGSKEKIVRTEEEEEEVESLRLDLPNTTQLTFSGRRIHDPHVTVPCCCSDPPPSIRISPRELKF